jgi:hypothetical protein
VFAGDGVLVSLLLAVERRQYIVYFFPDIDRGVIYGKKIFFDRQNGLLWTSPPQSRILISDYDILHFDTIKRDPSYISGKYKTGPHS